MPRASTAGTGWDPSVTNPQFLHDRLATIAKVMVVDGHATIDRIASGGTARLDRHDLSVTLLVAD